MGFVLVLARVSGIFSVAPIFGQARVPGQVRIILSVAMAAAVTPVVTTPVLLADKHLLPFVLALGREAVIGLSIGLVATLLLSAAQMAGELMDHSIGFGLSGMIDPVTNMQMPVIAKFLELLTALLFLSSGAYQYLIKALADSYMVLGPGEPSNLAFAARPITALFISMFIVALKIAAPILGILLLLDLALGLVARTTPQMNLLMVGFPLKIGGGMAAVLVALPVIGVVMTQVLGGMYGDIQMLMRALGR